MADSIIPQSGTTTPVIPAAQDLQINLAEAPKQEIKVVADVKAPEMDFDLNLNLSDTPKNDNRLVDEDQKNKETPLPTITETPVEETKTTISEATTEGPAKQISLEQNFAPMEPEPNMEAEPNQEIQSTEIFGKSTEAIEIPKEPTETASTMETENIGQKPEADLQNDMKIIDELEGHGSAGGLSPEAVTPPQVTQQNEIPKTFDLDAMFTNTTPPAATEIIQSAPIPTVLPEQPVVVPQTLTIPTTTTQAPVQAMPQVTIPPHKKNIGVKAFLFIIMFVGLGFTTFFVLKTMYPLEFDSILGGQSQMHGSETISGDISTETEMTGTETVITGTETTGTEILPIEEMSGTIDAGSGMHESATGTDVFGELGDLGTTTPPEEPQQNDIGKLTDYINQGNDFLTQGKALNNNTVIKYGLYISKKATTLMEDIANGKQIDNLSGYFAQFDKYIAELQTLLGSTAAPQNTNTPPEQNTPNTPSGFGDPSTNNDTTPTQTGTTPSQPEDTGLTAE